MIEQSRPRPAFAARQNHNQHNMLLLSGPPQCLTALSPQRRHRAWDVLTLYTTSSWRLRRRSPPSFWCTRAAASGS